ncbi:type II secretion system protein [Candidatus Saccharibacteria bacterium]|nr:type II secretion system protein [Candidatus Saccharibacteria bacterium]
MNIHKYKSQSNNKTNNNNQLKPKPSPKTNPAFTIIEVVLVLAIAGLIFLMVFIALPALQRNQRDAQRKRDIDRLYSAITRYRSNNKNTKYLSLDSYNDSGAGFVNSYLKLDGDSFEDPDGTAYSFAGDSSSGYTYEDDAYILTDFNHNIYIFNNTKCDGDKAVSSDSSNYSISYKLEGGGSYCLSGTGLNISTSSAQPVSKTSTNSLVNT